MSFPTPDIPLEEMTLRQLRRVASEYEVSRYSRMRKVELVEAIKQKQIAAGVRVAIPDMTANNLNGQVQVEAAKYSNPAQEQASSVGNLSHTSNQPGIQSTSTAVQTMDSTSASTNALGTASGSSLTPSMEVLATVDDNLPDLPGGYGESRIMLLPRDPQWAYTYWDIPNEHKQELRSQGGERLALRFYDVTDIDLNSQSPHSLQQYECGEVAREWYLPVPVSDRDYTVEIGYVCNDGRWLVLSRAASIRIPPVYPSDWVEDKFITVDWNQELRGRTFAKLVSPSQKAGAAGTAAGTAEGSRRNQPSLQRYGSNGPLSRSSARSRLPVWLYASGP